MRCQYPNCRQSALFTPIVEIPTIRTVGMVQPVLTPLARDPQVMRKAGLSVEMAVRQYEAAMEDYKSHCNDLVKTDKPTTLVGQEVCQSHRATYRFFDWFAEEDWLAVCEGARAYGVYLDIKEVRVQFKRIGWTPGSGHMEMER